MGIIRNDYKVHIPCQNRNFFKGNLGVTITEGHLWLETEKPERVFITPTLALFFLFILAIIRNRLIHIFNLQSRKF